MILILDDHPLARQGLYSLIQIYRQEEDILHAGTVREAMALTESNPVDMAFVDINLGQESGYDYLSWLKENRAQTKTFIITSSSRQSDFIHAQELGVDAYVLKDAFTDEILYGLKTVDRGGKFYSTALIERLNKVSEDERALSNLTEREKDVLAMLSQGYSNVRISQELFISEGTTKKHISNILGKLGLTCRIEAVLFASKNTHMIRTALTRSLKPNTRKEDQGLCAKENYCS